MVVLLGHGGLLRPRNEQDHRVHKQQAAGDELEGDQAPAALVRVPDHVHERDHDPPQGPADAHHKADDELGSGASQQVATAAYVEVAVDIARLIDHKLHGDGGEHIHTLSVDQRGDGHVVRLHVQPLNGLHCLDVLVRLDQDLGVDRHAVECVLPREGNLASTAVRRWAVGGAVQGKGVLAGPLRRPVDAREDPPIAQAVQRREEREHWIVWLVLVGLCKAVAGRFTEARLVDHHRQHRDLRFLEPLQVIIDEWGTVVAG
mmetsp:Transcript_78277/g.221347  ORF Transcript_78277/g.221347 Transcript_78277/m.221347 type:complete len:260 (+) Transcript_78277:743-1522(+)